MRSHAAFPTTTLNLRLLEEVLYDLPPLEGAFLHWHTYGVTATTAGMRSLLARRKQLLGQTTLSGASIQLLYACATDSLRCLRGQEIGSQWDRRPLHARLLRHGPTLSAAETQALLPPGVLALKTVSMTLGETSFLCTGVGPQRLLRQHLRAIAAGLALPGRTVKQCTIYPLSYNLVETFALLPKMVTPFLHPSHHADVSALILSPWPKQWEARDREVAIPLSLWESLVLPLRCLRQVIRCYASRAYPAVRIIELESEEMLYAHAEKCTG